MEAELRAGIAIFNAGEYHAAHDPLEDRWLGLESGTPDERLLHGLIQYTASIHHARGRNWLGATGLADGARSYLEGLPDTPHGVDLSPIRDFLEALRDDPETIERRSVPPIAFHGRVLTVADLHPEELVLAARVIAEEYGYDRSIVEAAATYARGDIEDGRETGPLVTLVIDFIRVKSRRAVVYRRLRQHVERRIDREHDADGLFEG